MHYGALASASSTPEHAQVVLSVLTQVVIELIACLLPDHYNLRVIPCVCVSPHMQVRMGFPQRSTKDSSAAVLVGADARLMSGSYTCPR